MRSNKILYLLIVVTTLVKPAIAQQYKTEIPAAVTVPNKVETRLGTLIFQGGFPDDATVQKVYDNLDFGQGWRRCSQLCPLLR